MGSRSLYHALHATARTLILPDKGKKGKGKKERRIVTAATIAYKVLTMYDCN